MVNIIENIKETIKGTMYENKVYLAGGFVRDEILGKPSKDIDLLIDYPNGGIEFAEWFCKEKGIYKAGSNPVIYPRFGTAKFVFQGEDIECVMPRKEVYTEDSRKPDTSQGTLKEDALRRDFTINTLFKSVSTGEVMDFTTGKYDLENGFIRTPLDADITFFDDPLRMLRCIRFSHKYGFNILYPTLHGIKKNAYRLPSISMERIQDELNKMLVLPTPSQAIVKLHNNFLLEHIIPELEDCLRVEQNKYHDKDVFWHIMNVLDKTPANLTVRLAALLHDIAKPKCKTTDENGNVHFYKHEFESAKMAAVILKRLKYSNECINDVCFLIENHMRTKSFGANCENVKNKSIRKLVDDLGERRNEVFQLIEADNCSHAPEYCLPHQMLHLITKISGLGLNLVYKIELPVNGNDVMEHFNIGPGKEIKDMLNHVRKMVYNNPDLTKEEAFKHLKGTFKL